MLAWLAVPGEDYARAVEADVDVTAYSVAQVEEIAAAARSVGVRARVQLKVDTGLSRGGATARGLAARWWRPPPTPSRPAPSQVTGIWSHFACSDEPDHPANDAQEKAFVAGAQVVDAVGIEPEVRHLSNSAGALLRPWSAYDLVRCGIASYGLSPAPDVRHRRRARAGAGDDGARPARAWSSGCPPARASPTATPGPPRGTPPSAWCRSGTATGCRATPPRRRTSWPAGAQRLVAGRVCMDQLVVDLGDDRGSPAGDEVVLFGTGADGAPTAQDWAEACGTISYEIVTRIGGRFVRRHVSAKGLVELMQHRQWLRLAAAGAGATAAAVTAGVVVERRVVRSRRAGSPGADELGALRSKPITVRPRRRGAPARRGRRGRAVRRRGREDQPRRGSRGCAARTRPTRPSCSCTATR